MLTVILFPTIFSVLWFAVFGGAGLHLELFGEGGLASLVLEDSSQALFALFSYFPYPMMLAVVAIFLILVFLSIGAASGAYVLIKHDLFVKKPPELQRRELILAIPPTDYRSALLAKALDATRRVFPNRQVEIRSTTRRDKKAGSGAAGRQLGAGGKDHT